MAFAEDSACSVVEGVNEGYVDMKVNKHRTAFFGLTLAAAGVAFLMAGAGGASANELLDNCNEDPETTAAECDCMVGGVESALTDNEHDFLVAMMTADSEDFEAFAQVMADHSMDDAAMQAMGTKMEEIEAGCQ